MPNKISPLRLDAGRAYYKWGNLRRDTFLFELAAVAGEQVPIGGMIHLKDYVDSGEKDYPYQYVFDAFFQNVCDMLKTHWPQNTDPVSFFMDNNEAKWIGCFRDVFDKWQTKEPRFSSFTFVTKNNPVCENPARMPLQAADLIAYRVRKGAQKHLETRLALEPCLLDHFLFRHQDQKLVRDIMQYRKSAVRAASKSWDEKFAVKLPS
ncbi:MAG TPA: hypothetical protein VGO59_12900 [Verrucomicrobiae bacterium]|jgi:hypothetical protein